jgi:hypothetical protein
MNKRVWKVAKRSISSAGTLVIVVASILWLSNFFGEKIPASAKAAEPTDLPGGRSLPAGGYRQQADGTGEGGERHGRQGGKGGRRPGAAG